jgi:hypothetical protein
MKRFLLVNSALVLIFLGHMAQAGSYAQTTCRDTLGHFEVTFEHTLLTYILTQPQFILTESGLVRAYPTTNLKQYSYTEGSSLRLLVDAETTWYELQADMRGSQMVGKVRTVSKENGWGEPQLIYCTTHQ